MIEEYISSLEMEGSIEIDGEVYEIEQCDVIFCDDERCSGSCAARTEEGEPVEIGIECTEDGCFVLPPED